MELICPECRGQLQAVTERMVVCPLHGGRYEVLFDRAAATAAATAVAEPAPEPATTTATCANHPRQAAMTECASCAKPLCTTCLFTVGGSYYCSDCAITQAEAAMKTCPECEVRNQAEAARCSACGHTFSLLSAFATAPPPVASRRAVPAELKCTQHPEVAAVNRCRACARGVCETCDFTFAGDVHICPLCVEQQASAGLSPARRGKMLWALGLAFYVTLALTLLLAGLLHRMFDADGNSEAFNTLIGLATLIPSIIGTALAFSAYDRRLQNPLGVKAAVWWNCLLLAVYMVLTVIGVAAG